MAFLFPYSRRRRRISFEAETRVGDVGAAEVRAQEGWRCVCGEAIIVEHSLLEGSGEADYGKAVQNQNLRGGMGWGFCRTGTALGEGGNRGSMKKLDDLLWISA